MRKSILAFAAVLVTCLSNIVSASPSLVYSTYLGTTVNDQVNAMYVDSAGNVYLTGQTANTTSAFPGTATHYQSTSGAGAFDAFVMKISPAGLIVWATY